MKSGGQIEIRLFPREGKNNEEYHAGDYGKAKCEIDLREYTFLLFVNKNNPKDRTLILKQKEEL